MAEHAAPEYAIATGNDYREHEETYNNVMKMTKVGTVSALCVVVSLALFGVAHSMGLMIFGLIATVIATVISFIPKEGSLKPVGGLLVLLLLAWAVA